MPARRTPKPAPQAAIRPQIERLPGARLAEMPRVVEPALADLRKFPPTSDDWLHEIKFDGYRLLVRLENGHVQLRTRQGTNWTARFPEIATPSSQPQRPFSTARWQLSRQPESAAFRTCSRR